MIAAGEITHYSPHLPSPFQPGAGDEKVVGERGNFEFYVQLNFLMDWTFFNNHGLIMQLDQDIIKKAQLLKRKRAYS